MQKEMSRQAHAKMMHRNRFYRDAYNFYYRFKTGSLSNPRVLVGLMGSIIGGIGFLFMSCAGGVLALIQMLTSG